VGAAVSRLLEALTWLSPKVALCLFLVGDLNAVSRPPGVAGSAAPREVRSYHLEDPDRRLGIRETYEHDLIFDRVPSDLEFVVASWLRAAIHDGAQVAWFAFEGSFHFDHLLARDVAPQVFGVADGEGILLALDDDRRANETWALEVEAVRNRLMA
jgi:hypothetical protein